jgi:ribosomal-protein-alanine N-acetyltransferase
MTESDVPEVVRLETEAFSSPWHGSTFHRLLGRPGAELWVLESEGAVGGYAVLWCILDQGEVANIAIRRDLRGQGLGGQLLDHLIALSRSRGVRSLFLEVRASNAAAARLYASRGFEEIGRRKGYYQSPPEDARVLELKI